MKRYVEKFYCLFFEPTVKIKTSAAREAAAKTAVHKPALKKPAIAEQPATITRRQANVNSTRGFIQFLFCLSSKKIMPQIVYKHSLEQTRFNEYNFSQIKNGLLCATTIRFNFGLFISAIELLLCLPRYQR